MKNLTIKIYLDCKNKKVKDNLEKCYFHTIYDELFKVYHFEVASGWNIPQYVRDYIVRYMKRNYGAKYYTELTRYIKIKEAE